MSNMTLENVKQDYMLIKYPKLRSMYLADLLDYFNQVTRNVKQDIIPTNYPELIAMYLADLSNHYKQVIIYANKDEFDDIIDC